MTDDDNAGAQSAPQLHSTRDGTGVSRRTLLMGAAATAAMGSAVALSGGLPGFTTSAAAATTYARVYNPWGGIRVSGDWLNHLSYSDGGTDYPTSYGTALAAPATGTLAISGGSGEFAAGWQGSAGRRAVLRLDNPAQRRIAAQQKEAPGDMVAIVFQHLAAFSPAGRYAAGAIVGKSGASAGGVDYGGDVHLHVHGLTGAGGRVDFTKFINATTPDNSAPIEEEDDMFKIIYAANSQDIVIVGISGRRARITTVYHVELLQRFQKSDRLLLAELDIVQNYLKSVA
jgi:hypothetical protein